MWLLFLPDNSVQTTTVVIMEANCFAWFYGTDYGSPTVLPGLMAIGLVIVEVICFALSNGSGNGNQVRRWCLAGLPSRR